MSKTIQNQIKKLGLEDLQALKTLINEQIQSRISEAKSKVIVAKLNDGHFRFSLVSTGKTYEAKKFGVRGRYKIFKMVDSKSTATGLKRGSVVVKEHSGSINDIKSDFAFGIIK